MSPKFTLAKRFSKPAKVADSMLVQDYVRNECLMPDSSKYSSSTSSTSSYAHSNQSPHSSSSRPRCLFARLPREIRIYIYTLVFSQERIEVIQSGARKAALRRSSRRASLLSLPLTCRQIHAESINILYSTPHFVLDDPATLPLLPTLLLSSIRRLTLEWGYQRRPKDFPECVPWRSIYPAPLDDRRWERFWYLVAAKMHGLKEMTLVLGLLGGSGGLGKGWVEPVQRVRGLRAFKLKMWLDELPSESDFGMGDRGLRRARRDVEKGWEDYIGAVVCRSYRRGS